MKYIWEQDDWPSLIYEDSLLLQPLSEARRKQGLLLGRLLSLGFDSQREALLSTFTEDVISTSKIEGEDLDRNSVRSSIARRLGVPNAGLKVRDRRAEGVIEMHLDAVNQFDQPLSKSRLSAWHAAMFPTGCSGLEKIIVGEYRDDLKGAMQVVSGPIERPRIHYQAPPADSLDMEMRRFVRWFNHPPKALDGVIRAGIAHLWFVLLHPFDDGNGRIARAVADMALAQDEKSPKRFYSLSREIMEQRKGYYEALERVNETELNITYWLLWFIQCFEQAIEGAEGVIEAVMAKSQFWQRHASTLLNKRQRKVIDRLLDGFEGGMTAKKWAAMGKCSIQTAQRDLLDCVEKGLMLRNPGGSKRTSYRLRLASDERL
ncbi:MAG: Fic family protein [Magnetococcales bacterium]|nr:Fic family protein [Magnetococcales bacterium]